MEGFENGGDKVSCLPGVDESSLRLKPTFCLGGSCREPAEGHGKRVGTTGRAIRGAVWPCSGETTAALCEGLGVRRRQSGGFGRALRAQAWTTGRSVAIRHDEGAGEGQRSCAHVILGCLQGIRAERPSRERAHKSVA